MLAWKSSQYAHSLKFSSPETLEGVRIFWKRYVDLATQAISKLAPWIHLMSKRFIDLKSNSFEQNVNDFMIIPMRSLWSAGPWDNETIHFFHYATLNYWRRSTILVAADSESMAINPSLMLNTSWDYAMPTSFTVLPLRGFHLGEAFDLKVRDKEKDHYARYADASAVAKKQFRLGLDAYARHHATSRFLFHHGDALILAHHLQHQHSPGGCDDGRHFFSSPWSTAPKTCGVENVQAKGESLRPTFDIIDTSNIADHVGLLNVLIANAPLLRKKPASVLYTESSIVAPEPGKAKPGFWSEAELCCDATVLALVLGIVPLGQLLDYIPVWTPINAGILLWEDPRRNFDIESIRHILPFRVPQSRDLSVFKRGNLSSIARIRIDSGQVVDCLFAIYQVMFWFEDFIENVAAAYCATDLVKRAKDYSLRILEGCNPRYTRASFAALIRLFSVALSCDWQLVLVALLSKIRFDCRLTQSTQGLEELTTHLRLLDIGVSIPTADSLHEVFDGHDLPVVYKSIFVPEVVWISITIPRHQLAVFNLWRQKTRSGENKTPPLKACINRRGRDGSSQRHILHCLHSFFGTQLWSNATPHAPSFAEDRCGWLGKSDMIVMFRASQSLVATKNRVATSVSVQIDSVASTFALEAVVSLEGLSLMFFDETLPCKRVLVTKQMRLADKHHAQALERAPMPDQDDCATFRLTWNASLNADTSVRSIGCVLNISNDTKWSAILKNKTSKVTLSEITACTFRIANGGLELRQVTLPFPYDSSKMSVIVRRKTSEIEVNAPPATAFSKGGYSEQPSPIIVGNTKTCPTPWDIPRLQLDLMPKLNLADHRFIQMPGRVAFWQSEIKADWELDLPSQSALHHFPLPDFKEHLVVLMQMVMGIAQIGTPGQQVKSICLASPESKLPEFVFYFDAIRHDFDCQSLVIDAYVVPCERGRGYSGVDSKKLQAFAREVADQVFCPTSDVVCLWRKYLPSAVERCRSWSHKSSCEYYASNPTQPTIPRSICSLNNPICTCGEGKDVQALLRLPRPSMWHSYARFATRIAIGLLWPAWYVRECVGQVRKEIFKLALGGNDEGHLETMANQTPELKLWIGGNGCYCCGQRPDTHMYCAKCRVARYCDATCQTKHWLMYHKRECPMLKLHVMQTNLGLHETKRPAELHPRSLRDESQDSERSVPEIQTVRLQEQGVTAAGAVSPDLRHLREAQTTTWRSQATNKVSQQLDELSIAASESRCACCDKSPPQGKKLSKCRGCGAVAYCDRDC